MSHELKNHIGVVLGASDILCDLPDLPDDQRAGFHAMIAQNARDTKTVVENLILLSAVTRGARKQRHIQPPAALQEATRLVRDSARAAGVTIRITDLPDVEVHAAGVELCVTNYLSNAIKYADPHEAERFVEISGAIEQRGSEQEVVVRVRDNGVGVPREQREQLFQLFFRAQGATVTGAEGTGLGLNIVRETAESLGGRAWAEFPDDATIFAFSLPYRRGTSVDKLTV